MFNFIKKSTVLTGGDSGGCEERDGDKERRKREKKERKEREKRERMAAGLEEPLRLEEVSSMMPRPIHNYRFIYIDIKTRKDLYFCL